MRSKNKIFADFNNADSEGRIRLNTVGTLRDIEEQEIKMRPGLEVLLDDNDGLQVLGVIQFSEKENIWVAIIDWGELK